MLSGMFKNVVENCVGFNVSVSCGDDRIIGVLLSSMMYDFEVTGKDGNHRNFNSDEVSCVTVDDGVAMGDEFFEGDYEISITLRMP